MSSYLQEPGRLEAKCSMGHSESCLPGAPCGSSHEIVSAHIILDGGVESWNFQELPKICKLPLLLESWGVNAFNLEEVATQEKTTWKL